MHAPIVRKKPFGQRVTVFLSKWSLGTEVMVEGIGSALKMSAQLLEHRIPGGSFMSTSIF